MTVVIVHQGTEAQAEAFFAGYPGARDYLRVSDPERKQYEAFALTEAKLREIFSPAVMLRGAGTMLHGHRVGEVIGNPSQSPGAFVIRDGRIVAEHRYQHIADRPDYRKLVNGAS